MPEGPEIHYAADLLDGALAGHTLLDVRFLAPALARRRKSLVGRRVTGVRARGKALLTGFDNGWTLYTHNHLLGFWRIAATPEDLASTAKPRVLLRTRDATAALYAAPKVELWRTDDLPAQPYLAKLGPDVLDPAVTRDDVLAQLRDPRFGRRSLGVLLLDQAFAAGMGNYLRSEALFQARLSPHRKPGELDAGDARRLADALLDVPRRSYRAKHDAHVPADKDYLENTRRIFRLRVFEREGLACGRCGGTVVNERIASRRLYWCPQCQR
jgi:endonuclease-8